MGVTANISVISPLMGGVIAAHRVLARASFTNHEVLIVQLAATEGQADLVVWCCERMAYPSLEQEGGKIGFEGLAAPEGERAAAGSFSVQFTPNAGDKQQLTDETQPSYKTFEGGAEQPTQASSEEINLLEKGATQSDAEKVNAALR